MFVMKGVVSIGVVRQTSQVFKEAIAEADRFLASGAAPAGFDLALQLPEDAVAAGQVGTFETHAYSPCAK